ncbi:hypothetical protein GGI42DRAFT_321710 [Trichoderma sp. SZMC 28013]
MLLCFSDFVLFLFYFALWRWYCRCFFEPRRLFYNTTCAMWIGRDRCLSPFSSSQSLGQDDAGCQRWLSLLYCAVREGFLRSSLQWISECRDFTLNLPSLFFIKSLEQSSPSDVS